MEIFERVRIRLPGEEELDELFILEAIAMITDRLNLRLGTVELPKIFNSIAVDAVVKVYRRKFYEGIESERIELINTKFVDNILDEYQIEITSYINSSDDSINKNVVRFI